jgi:hypothetical protein
MSFFKILIYFSLFRGIDITETDNVKELIHTRLTKLLRDNFKRKRTQLFFTVYSFKISNFLNALFTKHGETATIQKVQRQVTSN